MLTNRTTILTTVLYALMLAVMLLVSWFPGYRLWGFSHCAYYPSYIPIALTLIGLGLLLVVMVRTKPPGHEGDVSSGSGNRGFLAAAIALVIVFGLGFVLLRARTHFLGDGYQLLGNLPHVNPWIKTRNLGEELIHKFVFSLLSGGEALRALRSFQYVSYVSGLAFVASVAIVAGHLFKGLRDRLLFVLGLLSCGYMLLFLGYVENYSVFVLCVLLYGLFGLMVLNDKLKRPYILIPLLLAVSMHVLGAILIPSAVYLLIAGTPIGDRVSRVSRSGKIAVGAAVVLLVFGTFYNLWVNYHFFRFAFVPLTPNEVTVEGYTLFSLKHILDLVNLLYLLLPALPLFIATGFFLRDRDVRRRRDTRFLVIMSLSALAAVAVLDPKLGMPRDWDLFAFCAVPLALLGYYTAIRYNRPSGGGHAGFVVLAIYLGFVVLVPRVVGRARGDIEASHVENYLRFDIKKNMNLYQPLQDYYHEQGRTERARVCYGNWERNFPDWQMNTRALEAKRQGRFPEAIALFKQAIAENPILAPAYTNLAACYLETGQFNAAREALEIGNGLNPNSPFTLTQYAYLSLARRDISEAREFFKRALEIDREYLPAAFGLMELYARSGQAEEYMSSLLSLAARPEAPAVIHKRLGDLYYSQNSQALAENQYRIALEKGLSPAETAAILERFPHLGQ